ncbi:dienelactone hydrolase family protein [Novosphingobium sp. TH158]|uniref:dienelactone hydrolase family protein n=1 Tax=Novosphingobium sp. TH158 TaxID=2067455 RepID=UPI000C7C611B|nr:dienelactone hydrolase family protein [Novosphingobium sp. TH158]PLK25922.1 dienelactone hydrolase [Novosphingobium sp. TH158]
MSALERLDYRDGETALTGWLARPVGPPRGAIVVFPTIANVTPAIERRAAMLAEAGFLALIADFYGEPVASLEASRPMAEKLRADVGHYRRRLVSAVEALRSLPEASGLRLGAIGYCMGGQAALEVARAGEDLALVASFHGILSTDRPADQPIRPRLLVCHGDADPMVPREQVLAFWQEMDAVQAHWHFHAYSGVRHGFTDPGSDARGLAAIAYDASADRQSWSALMGLCDEVFA